MDVTKIHLKMQAHAQDFMNKLQAGDQKTIIASGLTFIFILLTFYLLCRTSQKSNETKSEDTSNKKSEAESTMGIINASDGRRVSARLKQKRERQERSLAAGA